MINMESMGIPLMPSVARRIIEELFKRQRLWKRGDLINEVERIHAERGGIAGNQDRSAVVSKALGYLQEDGKVLKAGYGLWQGKSDDGADVTADIEPPIVLSASTQEGDMWVAEKEIGVGPESVYVYFNPNDRTLASHERRAVWECKIGRTSASEVRSRIQAQGTAAAISHEPVVGLIIRTHDCVALEKVLHSSLRLIDARVPDSVGVEWFMTSPQHIEKWFAAFQDVLSQLSAD